MAFATSPTTDDRNTTTHTPLLLAFVTCRVQEMETRLSMPDDALATRSAETVSYMVGNLADLKVSRLVRKLIVDEGYTFTGVQHFLQGYLVASAQRMAGVTPDPLHVQTVAMVANLLDLMAMPEMRLQVPARRVEVK